MVNPSPPPRRKSLARLFLWLFARFDGRIGREVYWLSNLALVALLALFIQPFVDPETNQVSFEIGNLGALALLVAVVSSLAIGVKRLHDIGASGFFAIFLVVPVLSILATLAIGILPGQKGPNRYGEAADRPPP